MEAQILVCFKIESSSFSSSESRYSKVCPNSKAFFRSEIEARREITGFLLEPVLQLSVSQLSIFLSGTSSNVVNLEVASKTSQLRLEIMADRIRGHVCTVLYIPLYLR